MTKSLGGGDIYHFQKNVQIKFLDSKVVFIKGLSKKKRWKKTEEVTKSIALKNSE